MKASDLPKPIAAVVRNVDRDDPYAWLCFSLKGGELQALLASPYGQAISNAMERAQIEARQAKAATPSNGVTVTYGRDPDTGVRARIVSGGSVERQASAAGARLAVAMRERLEAVMPVVLANRELSTAVHECLVLAEFTHRDAIAEASCPMQKASDAIDQLAAAVEKIREGTALLQEAARLHRESK